MYNIIRTGARSGFDYFGILLYIFGMPKQEEKRGRGRPKLDPKSKGSKLIALRLSPAQLKAYERAAKQAGQGMSEWIRANLERAAGL